MPAHHRTLPPEAEGPRGRGTAAPPPPRRSMAAARPSRAPRSQTCPTGRRCPPQLRGSALHVPCDTDTAITCTKQRCPHVVTPPPRAPSNVALMLLAFALAGLVLLILALFFGTPPSRAPSSQAHRKGRLVLDHEKRQPTFTAKLAQRRRRAHTCPRRCPARLLRRERVAPHRRDAADRHTSTLASQTRRPRRCNVQGGVRCI